MSSEKIIATLLDEIDRLKGSNASDSNILDGAIYYSMPVSGIAS